MSTLLSPRLWAMLLMVAALVAVTTTARAQDEEPAEETTVEETEAVVEEEPAEDASEEPAEEEAAEAEEEEISGPTMGLNEDTGSISVALDTIWVMVAAFLVMFMQAGFCLVEAGLTRAKNVANICMKNLLDFSFGSIMFWLVGFGLMFSIGNEFMGTSGFMLHEEMVDVEGTPTSNFDPINWALVPLYSKFFFQLVFAATAATIVSGAMAERTKFVSYMVYSLIITAVIYPISGHWIWGGGWLADLGFWDFAGSTVVHSVGAWLALVGSFALGARTGKFDSSGKPKAIPGHNIMLVALGVFILWLGWFGFNPGSTMAADANAIALITVTTNSAAAAGAIAAIFTAKAMFGKWEATMALNGALAGLVSITAPCAWVTVPGALAIGAIGGVVVVLSVVFIEHTLKIDDPVGAISVHGTCGAWGTLAVGLFSTGTGEGSPYPGLFYGGDATQLIDQAIGVAAVFGWCIVTGAITFFGIKYTIGLRVTPEEEAEGLDFGEHGNEAYHGFQFASETS
ncbi:MAG: ammonium transporter [Planctomycetota bacterium]|nr:MAG: ammonium transporter [Planctomycetota bacterium]